MTTMTLRLPDLADRFARARAGKELRGLPPARAVRVDADGKAEMALQHVSTEDQ